MCRVFFNDTATTEIYTLSLHDALPISGARHRQREQRAVRRPPRTRALRRPRQPRQHRREAAALGLVQRDRKSTRLNSSHANISSAVFCLKTKQRDRKTIVYL